MIQKLTPWQEHEFWLHILNDHAHFVRDYLSPTEKYWVTLAKQFIHQFRKLQKKLYTIDKNAPVQATEMIELAQQIYLIAYRYYQFEGHLQQLRMRNQINLNLTPTYFNGTINENLEYLRLLSYYIKGKQPPLQPLTDLLDLWLDDQAGHAYLLFHSLDLVESETINQVNQYIQKFRSYILQNEQWKNFMRFTKPMFPAQVKFVLELIQTVIGFDKLVHRVVAEYKDRQVLTKVTLRFLEHHFPETCYFLLKLRCHLPPQEQKKIPDCQLHPPYHIATTS